MFSLHVDTARSWRGGQNQVLLTVLGLRAQGHRTALVAQPDGELRRRAAEGPDLIPIASSGEMSFRAAWQLARVLKALRPTVVHAHVGPPLSTAPEDHGRLPPGLCQAAPPSRWMAVAREPRNRSSDFSLGNHPRRQAAGDTLTP